MPLTGVPWVEVAAMMVRAVPSLPCATHDIQCGEVPTRDVVGRYDLITGLATVQKGPKYTS
jgi:hypothetical protein